MRLGRHWPAVALALAFACDKQKEPESRPTATARPTTTSTAPNTADVSRACGDVARALCAKFAACNTGAMLSIVFDDLAHCNERLDLVCRAELSAPDVTSTAADLAACAKAVTATPCGDSFDPEMVAECRWHGARPSGKACGVNAQCTSGFCDKRPPSEACGKCAELPIAGDECPAERCAPGLRCVAPGRCVAPVAIGAACDGRAPCASGGYCVAGKCAAPAKLGDACDPLAKRGPGCAEMITCDTKTKRCRPPTLATVGEACGLVGTELRPCTRAWCEAHGESGKCLARAADGAACASSEGCTIPATCVAGTCKLPDPSACR